MAHNPQSNTNFANSSIMAFSTLLAFITTVFAAPPLYGVSVQYVVQMLSRHYGPQFADLYNAAWMILTFLLVFIPARAFFYFALTALVTGILFRFV